MKADYFKMKRHKYELNDILIFVYRAESLTDPQMDPNQMGLHRWRGMQLLCQHAYCLVCALMAYKLLEAMSSSCPLQFQDY